MCKSLQLPTQSTSSLNCCKFAKVAVVFFRSPVEAGKFFHLITSADDCWLRGDVCFEASLNAAKTDQITTCKRPWHQSHWSLWSRPETDGTEQGWVSCLFFLKSVEGEKREAYLWKEKPRVMRAAQRKCQRHLVSFQIRSDIFILREHVQSSVVSVKRSVIGDKHLVWEVKMQSPLMEKKWLKTKHASSLKQNVLAP